MPKAWSAPPPRRPASTAARYSWCCHALVFLVVAAVLPSCSGGLPDSRPAQERAAVRQMLVFNSSSADDYGQEAGVIDYVWGADCQGTRCPATNRAVPGVRHEYYIPWSREGVGTSRTIEWFVENHPDWILYIAPTCGGRSTFRSTECVAYSPQGSTNEVTVPLDYTNPEVQDYIFREWIDPNMSSPSPFDGISWDDHPSEGALGRWTSSGLWLEKYAGIDGPDPLWSAAQTEAFREMRERFKRSYPEGTWSFNAGYFPYTYVVDWRERISLADYFMHEGGFTQRPMTESEWLQTVTTLVEVQAEYRSGLLLVNQLPYRMSRYLTDSDERARADVQWALANYLLVNGGDTYFWVGGDDNYGDGPAVLQQREFDPVLGDVNANAVGVPVDRGHGSTFRRSNGVYIRDYSNGIVVVNPSDTWRTMILPASAGYRSIYGDAIDAGPLALGPRSGIVLVGGPPEPRTNALSACEDPAVDRC